MPRDKRKDKLKGKARRKIRKNQIADKVDRLLDPEPYVVAKQLVKTRGVTYLCDVKERLFEKILNFSEEEIDIIQREVYPFMSLAHVYRSYTSNLIGSCDYCRKAGQEIFLGTKVQEYVKFTNVDDFQFEVDEIIYHAQQFDGTCYSCWKGNPPRYNEKFIAFRGSELYIIYSVLVRTISMGDGYEVDIIIRKEGDWRTGVESLIEAKDDFYKLWNVLEDAPLVKKSKKKTSFCF